MRAPRTASRDDHMPESAGFAVQTSGLTVAFGSSRALDSADLSVPAGAITGLLGRNGAGKTTLLSTIAGHRRPTAGSVRVDGANPWENQRVMEGVCLIQEQGHLMNDEKLSQNLDVVASLRPHWSDELAGKLMDAYELKARKTLQSLSRGQRSAFAVVVGLASRAPLTMLDEVHLGMDAPSRYTLYDTLLEDYATHPRSIIMSSHLIGEIERFLEHVIVLERGRPVVTGDADELRASHPGGLQELVVDLARNRRSGNGGSDGGDVRSEGGA